MYLFCNVPNRFLIDSPKDKLNEKKSHFVRLHDVSIHGQVKHFARKLITCLDDGDEIAMVTFGEDSEVFFPLAKLDKTTRVTRLK